MIISYFYNLKYNKYPRDLNLLMVKEITISLLIKLDVI